MSISMEKFSSEGKFASFDPFAGTLPRVNVFRVECRCCGFEPEDTTVPPRICPKCHGQSWHRFAKPGGILDNAERYPA
jgi:hypothetical protein